MRFFFFCCTSIFRYCFFYLNKRGFGLNTKRKIMREKWFGLWRLLRYQQTINIKFVEVGATENLWHAKRNKEVEVWHLMYIKVTFLKVYRSSTSQFNWIKSCGCCLLCSYTIESFDLVTCMWIMTNFTYKALCHVRIYISPRKVFRENENYQSRNCIIFSITRCVRRS